MTDVERQRQFVETWLGGVLAGAAPPRLLEVLTQAVAAIWSRAQQTLGDVTMQAVAERVAHHARARFTGLLMIAVDAEGMTFGLPPHGITATVDPRLRDAACFVLVELLTVLGNLTAGVLTPPLHEAIRRLDPGGPVDPGPASDADEEPSQKEVTA